MPTQATARPVNVLSLDGGGIRGLILSLFLEAIETRTGKPISALFDIIAGTSTGGILALALSKPKEPGSQEPAFKASENWSSYTTKTAIRYSPAVSRE